MLPHSKCDIWVVKISSKLYDAELQQRVKSWGQEITIVPLDNSFRNMYEKELVVFIIIMSPYRKQLIYYQIKKIKNTIKIKQKKNKHPQMRIQKC